MYVATASFQIEQIESKELKTKGKKKITKWDRMTRSERTWEYKR